MTSPSLFILRYFIARYPSAYLVARPNNANINIQNKLPAPPTTIAVDTPIILPVPRVADKDIHKAWNVVTSPNSLPDGFSINLKPLPSRLN